MYVRLTSLDCVRNFEPASDWDLISQRRPKMERWILCSSFPWCVLSPLIPCVTTTVGAFRTVRFCSQLEWVWGIEQPAPKTPKIWSTQEFIFVRKTCVRMGDVTWPLMSPVQSGSIWVLFNGFPFCTVEEAGNSSVMSMDTIHQSVACPLVSFSVERKSSGLVSAACGFVCLIHRHGTTVNLTSNKCHFSSGNAAIWSLGSNFHFLANLPFTQRHP